MRVPDAAAERLWLGLNSGTSADSLDLALVAVRGGPGARTVSLRAAAEVPWPADLQQRVRAIAAHDLSAYAALHGEVGRFFGRAAREFLDAQEVASGSLTAIASHGQTVFHHDGDPAGGTLQAGALQVLAHAAGEAVVGDFRWGDLAVGGQGAPISPFADIALLGADADAVVLNLGGIANLSWLRPGRPPLAWDSGPANGPLDALVRARSGASCDRDGAGALAGRVVAAEVSQLLAHPYFRLPAPKSTGLEAFGAAWTLGWADAHPEIGFEDALATLVEVIAASIAISLAQEGWEAGEVLLCGGGAHNPALVPPWSVRSRAPGCGPTLPRGSTATVARRWPSPCSATPSCSASRSPGRRPPAARRRRCSAAGARPRSLTLPKPFLSCCRHRSARYRRDAPGIIPQTLPREPA